MNTNQKYGFLGGLCSIVLMLGLYFYSNAFLEKQLMVHYQANMVKYLIFGVFMYLAIHALQQKDQSVKPLKDLIKPAFVCFLLANLIYHAFYFVMLKWIDPELITASNEYIAEFMEKMNAERLPGKLNDAKSSSNAISLSSSLFAYAKEVILGFIIAAILAFTRRNG